MSERGLSERDICDRAWAAGFFDGEGCTTLSGKYLYMQVKQVDEENIRRFDACTGWLGRVNGPYESKVETRRPIFVWRAHGRDAMQVMEMLKPWLGTAKREQWDRRFSEWDSIRRNRTHCRRGHLLSDDNVYRDKRSANSRVCKTCVRINDQERRFRSKVMGLA